MEKIDESLVSVIIPIYNVEKYIDECIESVSGQSYPNLEIILVDDASTDSSGSKCDEWAAKDTRIIVIHKPTNEGLNMARKTGFDVSNGQYVTFLDSDDYFHQDNIKDSFKLLRENGADIAIYGSKVFSGQDTKVSYQTSDKKHKIKLLATKNQIAHYALFGDGNLSDVQYMTVWGKLYARKVVKCVDWNVTNYRAYEDNFWTPQALLKSSTLVITTAPLIYYRRNVDYGVKGDNLGNRLNGNSLNGMAVGYLELLEQLRDFYYGLSHKYGLSSEFNQMIDRHIFLSITWRIDNLAKAHLLESENNIKYVLLHLADYIESKNMHIDNLSVDIKNLTLENRRIARLQNRISILEKKLKELSGVRRSIRLVIDNSIRKISRSKN